MKAKIIISIFVHVNFRKPQNKWTLVHQFQSFTTTKIIECYIMETVKIWRILWPHRSCPLMEHDAVIYEMSKFNLMIMCTHNVSLWGLHVATDTAGAAGDQVLPHPLLHIRLQFLQHTTRGQQRVRAVRGTCWHQMQHKWGVKGRPLGHVTRWEVKCFHLLSGVSGLLSQSHVFIVLLLSLRICEISLVSTHCMFVEGRRSMDNYSLSAS